MTKSVPSRRFRLRPLVPLSKPSFLLVATAAVVACRLRQNGESSVMLVVKATSQGQALPRRQKTRCILAVQESVFAAGGWPPELEEDGQLQLLDRQPE